MNAKTVGTLILIILVALLFFSKTLYTYNMPVVKATSPLRGQLTKSENSRGTTDYAEKAELYAELSGKITNIYVKDGDYVEKGQELMTVSYDSEEIEKKLAELEISRSKLALDIENIGLKIEKTNSSIEELISEAYDMDEISEDDIIQLEKDIQKAEEDYARQKILYDAGGLAKKQLDELTATIEALEEKKAAAEKEILKSIEKAEEKIADEEAAREKKLKDYEYELISYNQELKLKDIEQQSLALQETNYKKELANQKKNLVIYASETGIIISMQVKKGQKINDNQLIATFGIGKGYEIDFTVSADNNFIMSGDVYEISNSDHTLEGTVTAVTPNESSKTITMYIESEEATAGESFEIKFEKSSNSTYTLVPNSAVNQDSDGYFVYVIKRRDGMLGKEYYAEKSRIYIGDSDNSRTAVTDGILFFDPIVLLSDKAFSEGETIRIENESDFFED